MNPLKQDKKNNCGQTCVAMVAKKDIRVVEHVFGHDNFSTMQDVENACKVFGVKIAKEWKFFSRHIFSKCTKYLFPLNCFVNVLCKGEKGASEHLLVRRKGKFYDPSGRQYYILPRYMSFQCRLKIKK